MVIDHKTGLTTEDGHPKEAYAEQLRLYAHLVEERDAGAAVLIVSTELDEIMALSDRILVMFEGKIVATLDPKAVTNTEIGLYMTGSGGDVGGGET